MSAASSRRAAAVVWAGTLLVLLLVLGWARGFEPLALAGAGLVAGAVLACWRPAGRALAPRPRWLLGAAVAMLLLALALAAITQWRFERVANQWDELAAERREQLTQVLTRRLAGIQERGDHAARLAALAVADTGRASLFGALADVRERTGVEGIAVFGAAGELVAWAGDHQGRLPEEVRAGAARLHFEERPLFSYLYFVQPVPGRTEHVVAAILVETGLTLDMDVGFSDLFRAWSDTRVTFHARPPARGRPAWTLTDSGDTVMVALVSAVTQAEYRAEIERVPQRAVVLLVLFAFVLLALAWSQVYAPRRRATFAPLIALVPLLATAPLGRAFALESLFSPTSFVLPLPGDLTLGRLLVLLLPLAALVAGLRRRAVPTRRLWLPIAAGVLVVAAAYPLALGLLLGSATSDLLASGAPLWLGLGLTAVLVLTTVTALAMPRAEPPRGGPPVGVPRLLMVLGVASALMLGALVAARADADLPPITLLPALWAVPYALAAAGTAWGQRRAGGVRRWLLSGALAITAVLPHLWGAQLQARLAAAERDLSTLGSSDQFAHFLLDQFASEAPRRHARGEEGVLLLYRTWVASGLASESYQAHLALWDDTDTPVVQLGSLSEPFTEREEALLVELVQESRVEGDAGVSFYEDQPHMMRVLTLPLPDGHVITVVVPPRRTLGTLTGIQLFLAGPAASQARLLNLVPAQGPDADVHALDWERTREGWRSQTVVQYPDGKYYAHLLVPVPPQEVWAARAALIAAFQLLVLLLLWALGVLARGSTPLPRGALGAWLGSFRARITVALFGFFLLPTAAFGYVAYRALALEVERATESVAARAVRQAVSEFRGAEGDLRELASHAGADVLRYQHGELLEVSSPEALDLGVYGAWMPPGAYVQLRSGREAAATDVQRFGQQRFVTAYHSLPATGTLAVPLALVSGDTAVRQRQLSHLILFAVLVGALLSLALSVAVGRALAGPIGRLRRAAAAVGAGRLNVRLPEGEGGEFGQLNASFNRMARRLRRARAREAQSARVLAWGEMARQVAHEIKNPLTPIKLSVQHLRRAHRDRHPEFETVLESSAQEILREIDRLSEIARAFSRYGAPAAAAGPVENVDIAAVVREALTLYRASGEPITYHAVVDPGVPRVQARTGELKEVLLNLLENARAALDGAGEVVVRALAHGESVDLEVEDNGSGIPRELHDRVFDPHFSTRSSGTGLGLAIVRRLVESWGGTVSVESHPGRGTTVRVRLRPVPPPSADSVSGYDS